MMPADRAVADRANLALSQPGVSIAGFILGILVADMTTVYGHKAGFPIFRVTSTARIF